MKRRGASAGQVILFFIIMAVVVVLMYMGMMLRDYNLTFEGGMPTFVAKEFIPVCQGVNVNNTAPGKLIVSTRELPDVDGYEFRISRFNPYWFPTTQRTVETEKEFAMLSEGRHYYLRVRAYKKNTAGRIVHGQWSPVKEALVRRTP